MRAWWQRHWEAAVLALCLLACLVVVGLAAWEWVVDMNAIP